MDNKVALKCDMGKVCQQPVTHLDYKGYAYCTEHGQRRRMGGIRCRKLRSYELRRLQRGETLKSY